MKNIQEKIDNCHKAIENLYMYLRILGTGVLAIIAIYSFLGKIFNIPMVNSMLVIAGTMMLFICFTIFKKFAIIEKLNLKEL